MNNKRSKRSYTYEDCLEVQVDGIPTRKFPIVIDSLAEPVDVEITDATGNAAVAEGKGVSAAAPGTEAPSGGPFVSSGVDASKRRRLTPQIAECKGGMKMQWIRSPKSSRTKKYVQIVSAQNMEQTHVPVTTGRTGSACLSPFIMGWREGTNRWILKFKVIPNRHPAIKSRMLLWKRTTWKSQEQQHNNLNPVQEPSRSIKKADRRMRL